ncbi:MAG: DUF4255 domain-containing protein [Proteobacteria bacterium]|nr:DUF4255 domain-containing protein [Pseudomonadota bacterium]
MQTSTLSRAANALRAHLNQEEGKLSDADIQIGHPARFSSTGNGQGEALNIFIYHVEHSGYPAHTGTSEPYFVKLHCLLTPMTEGDTAENIGPGDMELRLLGHAMEILHKDPVVNVTDDDGSVLAQLQTVPTHMSVEETNRIFSTQFETSYRVSVAYELALVPVFVEPPRNDSPRVAAIEVGTSPEMVDRNRSPGDPDAAFINGRITGFEVDTSRPDWEPHIVFVDPAGQLTYALRLQQSPGTPLPPARVLGFGTGTATLQVQRRIGEGPWQQIPDRGSMALNSAPIDPDTDYSSAPTTDLPLDGDDAILDQPGQAWVWVERVWQREDRPPVTIRSNAIAITITEEQP